MIRLIGPGGAGKSTIGALLARRLDAAFADLDRHFADRAGDISEYIGRHGYDAYARENVEAYCSLYGSRGSFLTQRLHGVDACCASRRKITRRQGCGGEHWKHSSVSTHVRWGDAVEQPSERHTS